VKQIRKRLTYANVMSSIAVFLVLGGATAIAANQLGKNTVGSKQLKANAVTTAKIKKDAVTTKKIKKNAIVTAKIKDGAITGAKVNLGSLGTVPSATNATNAENATNWSRYFTTGIKKASAGQDITLFTVGPFTATGHCRDIGGGEMEAWATLTTSQGGSSMSSYETSSYFYEADFDPGDEGEIGYFVDSTTPENNDSYGGGAYYNAFTAASGDGKTLLSGQLTSAVYYYGSQCAFWGHGTNNA
jgi:hypothetical protein